MFFFFFSLAFFFSARFHTKAFWWNKNAPSQKSLDFEDLFFENRHILTKLVPIARQNIVGFLKFSTTSSCGCKKLEEIPKKKNSLNPTPQKNRFYFVIFEVLRNIIKIYYFFLFHFIRGNGTCCPCPTCCFPCSPGPCADRASLP